jgi:hypothetical protein
VKLQSKSFLMEMTHASNLQPFIVRYSSIYFYFCNHPNHQKPSLVPSSEPLLAMEGQVPPNNKADQAAAKKALQIYREPRNIERERRWCEFLEKCKLSDVLVNTENL